jgi:hypothetical protein
MISPLLPEHHRRGREHALVFSVEASLNFLSRPGNRGRPSGQSPPQPGHSPWRLGAAAARWLQPPVRQCSIQSQGPAAAQPLSALVGCPWLSQPLPSRPSCSRPICNSRGTALAPAALLRFAVAQRVLPLPRHAHVRRARGQRLRAPPSGYRLSALHNPRDGGGNRSRQFQPQPGRSAVAVCDRQVPDASPASAGQLKTEAAACSGAVWRPLPRAASRRCTGSPDPARTRPPCKTGTASPPAQRWI